MSAAGGSRRVKALKKLLGIFLSRTTQELINPISICYVHLARSKHGQAAVRMEARPAATEEALPARLRLQNLGCWQACCCGDL